MINKKVFGETKNKLIKINILVVSSFLIIFSLFTYFYFQEITYNSIDETLKEEYDYIALQINRTSYLNPIVLNDPRDLVYIYDDDRLIYYTKSDYFDKFDPDEQGDKTNACFTYKNGNYTFRELSVTINDIKIRIIRNIDSELSSLKQLFFVICIGIVFSIIITYFVALYLTRKALLPIENAWSLQAKFIQDASHELRTPLTSVSTHLEAMITGLWEPSNKRLESCYEELNRITTLVKDLEKLANVENGCYKLQKVPFDMFELLKKVSYNFEYKIKEKKIKFELIGEKLIRCVKKYTFMFANPFQCFGIVSQSK